MLKVLIFKQNAIPLVIYLLKKVISHNLTASSGKIQFLTYYILLKAYNRIVTTKFKIYKAIVIFELRLLEFVKNKFLTLPVNFDLGFTFAKDLRPTLLIHLANLYVKLARK